MMRAPLLSTVYDVVIIGGGPAGQKAAVQAAKAGKSVVIIESERSVGGHCVRQGTIPSKTLREAGLALTTLKRRFGAPNGGGRGVQDEGEQVTLESLMSRVADVVRAHESFMTSQLERNGIARLHGRATFVDPHTLAVESARSTDMQLIRGETIVIATGSRPRTPDDVAVDHENIFDSDSILSMMYVPRSLVVLGGGVIAYEYACIFQALGTKVVVVDPGARPLPFLDAELTAELVSTFHRAGGQIITSKRARSVRYDGVSEIVVDLDGFLTLRCEKLLCARGRVANVEGLGLDGLGIKLDARGNVPTNPFFQTVVPHIYAVGDVIGPPSLASASMDQGRRAMAHALGIELGAASDLLPVGVFTIPEIASVGLTEEKAREQLGRVLVGRAVFDEVARGQINGTTALLKLVADPTGHRIVGAHVVGEGAAELVHLAQVAMIGGVGVDALIDSTFNFPTMAEAYRIAALDIVKRRRLVGALSAHEEPSRTLSTARPAGRHGFSV